MSKKAAADLTARTLKQCRDKGWQTMKTEYWLPSFASRKIVDAAKTWKQSGYGASQLNEVRKALDVEQRMGPGVRKDLFGFIDVFTITPTGFLAIQVTSWTNTSNRVMKIKTECLDYSRAWLEAGGRIEVWGWMSSNKCPSGCAAHNPPVNYEKAVRWHCKITDIKLEDMPRHAKVGMLSADPPF